MNESGELSPREFAEKMLELETLKTKVAQLEAELSKYVLLQKATQRIGAIEATYSPGRTTYDWKATCDQHAHEEGYEDLVAKYTEEIPPQPASTKTDWAGIAHIRNWDPVVSKDPVPSVKFKIG